MPLNATTRRFLSQGQHRAYECLPHGAAVSLGGQQLAEAVHRLFFGVRPRRRNLVLHQICHVLLQALIVARGGQAGELPT
jgi:hypothetical protein